MAIVTDTFTTPGADTWEVPVGAIEATIEVWGGGGGGGERGSTSVSGGGGGGYSRSVLAVTPLDVHNLFVGAGGTGNGNSGLPGQDSWFGSTSTVMAKGGGEGSRGSAATGGQASAGVGTVKFSGGGANNPGGGGGGGAGDANNGSTATGTAGAAGGVANGGNGGARQSPVGQTGGVRGGGGGSGDGTNGGTGGRGEVRITYELAIRVTTGIAAEADTALTSSKRKLKTSGIAAEADSGLEATVRFARTYFTGIATETDSALEISAGNFRLHGATWMEWSTVVTPPTFEIAYEANNRAEAPAWYDATDDVRKVQHSHIRQPTLDRWEALSGSAVVDNRNRQHEPWYVDSPHYPHVRRRRQWRMRSGIGTPISRGYISDIDPRYPSGQDSVVDLTLSDAFSLLATTPLRHPYEALVMSRSPRGYYRLQDRPAALPATMADISGNERHGTYAGSTGSITFGDSMVNDSLGARAELHPVGAVLDLPATLFPGDPVVNSWAIEFLFWPHLFAAYDFFTLEGPGGLVMRGHMGGGMKYTLNFAAPEDNAPVRPGRPQHVVINSLFGDVTQLMVDGVLRGSRTTPAAAADPGLVLKFGNQRAVVQPGWLAERPTDQPWMSFAELAVYPRNLLYEEIDEHLAMVNALEGQLTGERADYIADQTGWTPLLRDIAPGQVSMGPAVDMGGQSALEALKRVAGTAAGEMFFDEAGQLKLTDHLAPWLTSVRSRNVQAVFGDGEGKLGYRDPVFAENDELSANMIRVNWSYGGTIERTDPVAIEEDGGLGYQTDSSARYLAQAEGAAEWLAWAKEHPRTLRVARISNTLRNSDQEAWLAIRKWDRVKVEWQVKTAEGAVGPLILNEGLVSGIHHSFARGVWIVTLELVPVPDMPEVWEWGVSAWGESTRWGWGRGDVA